MVPTGASGKKFVNKFAKWLNFWNQESDDYMAIALKVVMVMPAILLQKPSFKSTSKEHSQCLERRLGQWEKGEFDQLLHEMRTIQSKLPTGQRKISEDLLAKRFAKLMFEGKVNSALRLLDTAESIGNVLPLSPDTIEKLKQKHPTASEAHESVMMNGPVPFVDPVLYQSIDAKMIMNASLKTKGASGPSGFDAESWRRILVSKNFGNAGHLLRETVAAFARKMCVSGLDPDSLRSLEAFIACRLIPLDKNPGVRPIGVGEVLRRIVGKAVVFVIKPEIMSSAGNLQLCAGQQGGSEASVHAMTDIFDEESTDALLLVDATNAFNCLNRNVLLNNIKYLCPPMATYVTNCYSMSSRLFVTGGFEISSSEGTTQGDPLAMPIYAIGITPLLCAIIPTVHDNPSNINVRHAAFADDIGGAGSLEALLSWWLRVQEFGPRLGYYPNAGKSWLVVKGEVEGLAKIVFDGTGIQITADGRRYLGSFIGSGEGKVQYVEEKIDEWCSQLKVLSKIGKSEPHAAYTAFVSGFRHRLTYYLRTIPNIEKHLKTLDEVIDKELIPALTGGHLCTPDERLLVSLPVRYGGLAIPIFSSICKL